MTEPRLLGGRYELEGVVGRGGMAEVYRGRDTRLDRQVAIKALRADLASDATFQARFRREAQSAASLNHPAIVAVYDTGEDVLNDTTVPYIVMEYAAGRTLRDMLRDDRHLLPERGLEIVEGVLRALEYSHSHGIVHRDIKPANIMITTTREVKVMDFGIARAMHDASSAMTQTAQVVGTAQYLSPEQARGERVDARSDVYSAGCVLYEILTGSPPFRGDSPVSIAYQHVREEPIPPSRISSNVPAWADPIVLKAITKDPNGRYQTAAEMHADIQRVLAGQQISPTTATTRRFTGETERAPSTQTLPTQSEEETSGQRRRWPWVVVPLALIFLAAMGTGGWYLTRGLNDSEKVEVPRVVGLKAKQAKAKLAERGLEVTVKRGKSEQEPGIVYKQRPDPTAKVEPGTSVTIFVSKRPGKRRIPNVIVGLDQSGAVQTLQQRGFTRINIKERESSESEGEVIEVKPPEGSLVPPNTRVTLIVSSGPGTFEMPDVSDLMVHQATTRLLNAGFDEDQIVTVPVYTRDAPPGAVLSQEPVPGDQVTKDARITLQIARTPTTTPTPTTSDTPTDPPTQSTSSPSEHPSESTSPSESSTADDGFFVVEPSPSPHGGRGEITPQGNESRLPSHTDTGDGRTAARSGASLSPQSLSQLASRR